MKIIQFLIFWISFFFVISSQMRYFPDTYKENDLIFPDNDDLEEFQYNLVDSKVLTKESITLYLKKQGIKLDRDNCCTSSDYSTLNAWAKYQLESESDLKEIYSNAIYNNQGNILTYNFPVKRIEHIDYEVYHKLYIFDNDGGNSVKLFFTDENGVETNKIPITLDDEKKKFLTLKFIYNNVTEIMSVFPEDDPGQSLELTNTFSISKINFENGSKSPAISLHWTYYKIKLGSANFSLKGIGICNYENPCVKGYTCVGGLCERCHASCFDCKNGGLTTDCDSKCSTHSTLLTPDRGSCPLAYADLTQFDSFTIEDIVPPPRNNRFTFSFWIYLSSFPQNEINGEKNYGNPATSDYEPKARLLNSYDNNLNFTFFFSHSDYEINCNDLISGSLTELNTWIYIKCGTSPDKGERSLLIKYYQKDAPNFIYIVRPGESDGSGMNCYARKYNEPEDYITLWFEGFNSLYNNKIPCNFYIKQFVIFREYVPDPYDNKYFSMEKLFVSTYELPEVMFIIPFDELIRNDNKFDVKCYTYSGSILENKITLTPYYYQKNYTLFPPKLFRRLNLLERNKKYLSPDLIELGNVIRDNNTLIASYDNVPLTCVDKYFLTYRETTISTGPTYPAPEYEGFCSFDCDDKHSMYHGLSESKGFCSKTCEGDDNEVNNHPFCLSNNEDLLNLRTKFRCKSGYYRIFYNCDESDIEKEKKTVFHYNHDHGPANIVLDLINYNLKSYIIEFWIYLSSCSVYPPGIYYIFYTNQFQIKYYYYESITNVYTEESRNSSNLTSDYEIKNGKWNHMAVEVFYDPKAEYNRKTVINIHSKFYSENSLEIDHTENILPLRYIYFCNGRKATCRNLDIPWYCAFYKNLRVFNGDLAHKYVTFRYDEYYWDYKYLLSSIKIYYPLYGHYIANNLWSQYNNIDSALNTNSPTNNWNFPQYGYCTVNVFNPSCGDNCEECFFPNNNGGRPRCYQCKEGFYLYKNYGDKSEILCKQKNQYVLRLPSKANFELVPLEGLKHSGVTVTMFIKIYGFSELGKIDIIYLGENLKISYNSDMESDYYGLNLVAFKESKETVISNYYHFRKHFGVWTFISVSTYDKTYETFFPPMVRFEINDKVIPIIGELDYLSIGTIYFSDSLFALVQRVNVYGSYYIGTHSLETNDGALVNEKVETNKYLKQLSYFIPVENKSDCLFNRFNLIAKDKVNPDLIIDEYECVPDDITEIYKDSYRTSNKGYYNFKDEVNYIYGGKNSCNGECDICFGAGKQKCTCNFRNNEQKIFLGNVTNHYCRQLKYRNFAKIKDKEITGIKTGRFGFTLHFWVFAHSYVDKSFKGISVEWKGHTTVQVGLDSSGKYYFTCLINGEPKGKYVDFVMNEWNFLHCAVNYNYSKYYIASENRAYSDGFTYTVIPEEILASSTSLILKDLTNVQDWGVLFFRYIRLWKEAFKYSSFLSRIHIINNYFSTSLLHQWDTEIYQRGVMARHRVYVSPRDWSKYFEVEYSEDKIGTNIVPEEIYQKVLDEPYLCNEDGQFYDRKTKTCVNFTDASNIEEDFTVKQIDVSYSHNYGIAFWIFFENHRDIEKPINFIWQYHMQLSLQFVGNTFKAYCFPQNYKPYSDILENSDFSLDEKTKKILNSATNEYTDDLSGSWTWFQCSLSYYNRYFYLNENRQNLISETLYKEGTIEYKNDEPLGYFFNGITEDLSSLKVEITANRKEFPDHKRIYLRCLYLFNDFLPFNYDFKYMDMYQIINEQFPPLALVINFDKFGFENRYTTGKFYVSYNKFISYSNKNITCSTSPCKIELKFSQTTQLELSANFVFLPLCNPKTNEKYNFETQLCQEIKDCDRTALNALHCMGEATPLICKKNYYINIDSNQNKIYCSNFCEDGKTFRSPGTPDGQGICGTDCLNSVILKTCPNSASSILEYQEKFECNPGYNRIGYQCIQQPSNQNPNEGALFYSGGNNPFNIDIKISSNSDLLNEIGNDYVLEFWFMIDNVIYTDFKEDTKYYYFYSKPHTVYLEKDSSGNLNYFYSFNGDAHDISNLINKYEWNKILIFVDGEKMIIKIFVNFDKVHPEYVEPTDTNNLKLEYIAFCSKMGIMDTEPTYAKFPVCVKNGINIEWASAYYNNIRVWNLKISTIDTIQSFVNKIYLEHPSSLILFYPLTIKYIDNNQFTNIMSNYENEHFTFNCKLEKNKICTAYNKDNLIIHNYSTKFDWGLLHKKQFVSVMYDTYQINPNDPNNDCNEHCIRCLKTNDITECYECEPGYVLQYKECKDARKLYFLKTPSGTAGASINFVTINKENKNFCVDLTNFTIVFWMKFFGIKYPTITEYVKIFSIDTNSFLAYHRSTTYLVFRENSKDAFIEKRFRNYFGVWIPIAIANYISNSINSIYPNMLTLSVNKIDIPFAEGYSIPESGIKATELSLGYEIIALFAELSIYSKFIQGAYGRVRSEQYLKDQFYYKSLTGTKSNDCLVVDTDLQSPIDLICATDYSVNFIDSYYCKDDTKYFNPYDENNDEKPNEDKCNSCDGDCLTLCYHSSNQNCTCDMTDGIYWLRRTGQPFDQTYCEHIYHLDFSNIQDYTYKNAPVTKTKEYTIEFWVFVYSYNLNEPKFKEMYIEWNFHNRIRLYDEEYGFKIDCQPIWRSFDFAMTTYSDIKTSTLKYYNWEYVRCGTDLKNRKYFSQTSVEYNLKAKKDTFFDFDEIEKTATSDLKFFKISKCEDFYHNFGYVFIREIKLWQQYNIDYLDSKNIYFDMNEITKEDIKKKFPGLLLYYINDFNLTVEGNSVIKEILSDKVDILTRTPDYLGYNIVDPLANNIVSRLEFICPFGQVYNYDRYECECPRGFTPKGSKCDPIGSELDALCETYSNTDKQCLQCKENNQYLNRWPDEFGEVCYSDCPPTLYEDPLINQCRRCHETCYECTNEFYNNCTSCTGTLYFNFKENTCIPNCQAADLTRSLTKPNICVVFDAGANLINVDELIPVNINTFDYIEAEVVLPTSPEYETLWLFDANKTNYLNRELGFTDDIPLDSEPFTGDKSKLNTPLNHTFFKTEHLYVFGLKIYAENKGLEVAVYVWWTLKMNSPPYGGKLTVMPYLGLYNTTTFIMRCVDYQDENTPTEELEYDFYYVEVNTNYKIKLSKEFSLNNEVYSNFTVRFFQLEYSNITLYCQCKDKWGAISEASNTITIVNKKNSPLYILKQLIASFYITNDHLTDIQLLARSEVLMSLGINPYTERMPSSYFSTYEGSLTGEKVLILEPQCISGYCNDNGDCEVIDVALTCKCLATHLGKQCFLDKNGYADLSSYYLKMYSRLYERLNEPDPDIPTQTLPINDEIFQAFYKLFFAAQNFFQNDTFFLENLVEFKTFLKNEIIYITYNVDRLNKLLDLDDFFFTYYYVRETQIKLTKKINEGYPFRNKTLTEEECSSYQIGIDKFFQMLHEDTIFLIKNYGNDYDYTCSHFAYHLKKIDETFNDEEYFESLKTVLITYKPTVKFMQCLKQKFSSFNYYLNYIEYLVNPMSFDRVYYPNVTSPFITIKIFDLDGNEIEVNNCDTPIKINMPFNAYDWINYINEQKWLFLPENYKLEDDPIFRDPILIWDNGSISDDTVEQRIAKYYRYHNIVGLVYTQNSLSLYEYTSFLFKNISDAFFLLFETNHLSSFSSMIIPNIMNFVVDGRFYYVPRYMVLVYYPNSINNPVFFIILGLLLLFIITSLVFKNNDFEYFDKLEDLEFLKKEIIKSNNEYNQYDTGLNDENIIVNMPQMDPELRRNQKKKIRTMFDEYDMEGIDEDEKENENDNDNEKNDYISNIMKDKKNNLNTLNAKEDKGYSSSRRNFRYETSNNGDDDEEREKVTEIRTNKRRKERKKTNKSKTKDNPPPKRENRKNAISDGEEGDEKYSSQYKRSKKEREENGNNNKSKAGILKKRKENTKTDGGYGDGDEAEMDFDEKKLEKMSSDKSTITKQVKFHNIKQNYDLQTLNSKLGINFTKYSKFSQISKSSNTSKKSYFIDKGKTKANMVSLQKFHDHSKKYNIDKNIPNKEEERKKALEDYVHLSVSPFEFFKYNLKTRHILVAPFLNLTLYHNRWKKLMVLLTQFYIQQLALTVILTSNENITISNFAGMLVASLLSGIISNILISCYVFLFSVSVYDRMRLFRFVMKGEDLSIFKSWSSLENKMRIKAIIGIIISITFWVINMYMTLIFTAVWAFQRSGWIICFIMTLFLDLVVGEICIEGICAILYILRKKYNFWRNLGFSFNNFRRYRTMWP